MSRFALFGTASVFAAVFCVASAAGAATPPSAGDYNGTGLYTAVSSTDGASCPVVGSTFGFVFTYPGPGKTGASGHSSALKQGDFSVGSIIFSKTPAAGATTWNGTAVSRSSSGPAENTAKFQGVLQFFDASSFLATLQWQEKEAGGGTCDESIELTFVKN